MVNTKYLGLEINHLNWKNPIDQMITKLSGAFYTVRLMFNRALLTPKSMYFTNFNGLSNSEKIFALHKKIVSVGVCKHYNFIFKSLQIRDFTCSMPVHMSINELHCKWPRKF
jgi:hypothetical protein